MTHVNDAAVLALKQLAQEGHRICLEQACTINTLRSKLAQLENANAEMVMATAETNASQLALEEIADYIAEKVRVEREACGEPGLWARTPMGNSVALTLYADLFKKIGQVRTGYGV